MAWRRGSRPAYGGFLRKTCPRPSAGPRLRRRRSARVPRHPRRRSGVPWPVGSGSSLDGRRLPRREPVAMPSQMSGMAVVASPRAARTQPLVALAMPSQKSARSSRAREVNLSAWNSTVSTSPVTCHNIMLSHRAYASVAGWPRSRASARASVACRRARSRVSERAERFGEELLGDDVPVGHVFGNQRTVAPGLIESDRPLVGFPCRREPPLHQPDRPDQCVAGQGDRPRLSLAPRAP